MRKSIVLAADNAYLVQLETTIKSILCHNTEVDFYILNSDIAPEWFKLLGKKMEVVSSTIRNVHLDKELFEGYKTGPHINYTSYFRFLTTEVVESERVLYLDCDIIVTRDLSPLFEMNLKGYYLGAVDDIYAYEGRTSGFNAGVLLMDAAKWKENLIVNSLLELAAEQNQTVHLGDQSILNIYFENKWLRLEETYNFMVGVDTFSLGKKYERLEDLPPAIVHFASHDKQWNTYSISRLRELWWAYRDLDWTEIISRKFNLNYYERTSQSKNSACILTWVLEVEHLEYLIKSLPEWHFHIGAPVYCASDLTKLSVYRNVTLYQSIIHNRIDWMLDDSTVYLDINHGAEVFDVLSKARDRGRKIFTFDNTRKSSDDSIYDGIFSVDRPDEMIELMKSLGNKK